MAGAFKHVYLLENSKVALKAMKESISYNSLQNTTILDVDILNSQFDNLIPNYDNCIIICNPPYVPLEKEKSVIFEPFEAIYSGRDGLDFFRNFSKLLFSSLLFKNSKYTIIELDPRNILEAIQVINSYNLDKITTHIEKDEEGFDRFLIIKKIT